MRIRRDRPHRRHTAAVTLLLAVVAPTAILEAACGARSALDDWTVSPGTPDAGVPVDSAAPDADAHDAGADVVVEDAPVDAPVLVDASLPAFACAWSRAYGIANGGARVGSLAVDPDGNILLSIDVVGAFDPGTGPIGNPNGGDYSYVVKVDPNGQALWGRQLPSDAVMHSLAVGASGNIVVVGTLVDASDFGGGPIGATGDLAVVELAPDGSYLWSRAFAGHPAQVVGVTLDGAGNVLLTGTFQTELDLGDALIGDVTAPHGFVAKLDPVGEPLWAKAFGTFVTLEALPPIAADATGNVGLTGWVMDTADFGSGPIGTVGKGSLYVVKLSPGGDMIFGRAFPVGLGSGGDIAFAPDGSVLVAGWGAASIDFGGGLVPPSNPTDTTLIYVAALTGSGAYVYAHSIPAPYGKATAIGVSPTGGAWVSGIATNLADGGPLVSAFFSASSPTGATLATIRFGGATLDEDKRLAVHPSGDVVLAGTFNPSIDFGDGPLGGAVPITATYLARCTP